MASSSFSNKVSLTGCDETSQSLVTARIGFLEKNSAFDHEEPYAFRYHEDIPCPMTNMKFSPQEVRIHDLRGQENEVSLDTCGFEIRKLRTPMSYAQFSNEDEIHSIYCENVKKQLKEDFGAIDVDFARVRVRRRDPAFPKSTGKPFKHHQPSTAAHIDLTSDSARSKICELRSTEPETYLEKPFKVINVWKPLLGPLEDWPLALCDSRTVDQESDLVEATILHQEYQNRNCQVHFNAKQQWWYLSGQQDDELIVFRQYDSRLNGNNGVPHSSFEDISSPSGSPRESIELMAILYYA